MQRITTKMVPELEDLAYKEILNWQRLKEI